MDREGQNSTAMGREKETKMDLELDAAHALANLAGSDPISNQSSISQEEMPCQFQAEVAENSKEVKGNRCQNQTLDNMEPSNSINQAEVSPFCGQKKLNEADRDAKRLHRILANRESARQTILRRQAFRDELARKVSILSAENLVLKKEKENATREYFYQKEMNQQLKEQGIPPLVIFSERDHSMMQTTPSKEENTLQTALPPPAPDMPVTLSMPVCAISNEAPTVIRKTAAKVSCSLMLGIGMTKDVTAEQRHEAVTPKQKLNQLQSEADWREGCTPYLLLNAAAARRRRMEIARSKQLSRN